MNVLIVGSGGREHALAWKLAQSSSLTRLWILPGNPGTAAYGKNIPGKVGDTAAIVAAARLYAIDLVVIGPEAPLAAGLADALRTAGVAVFGPSQAAAQIETSKAFAKDFMKRHNIPTAGYETFDSYVAAAAYVTHLGATNCVIKASGLASGKGVFLPENDKEGLEVLQALLVERVLGASGGQIVIEERLRGSEVSVLAFTDGQSLALMPAAQDHKRLREGDQGPNTGGMGAFAPAVVCSAAQLEEIQRTILQPVIDGMRQEGRSFTGVLYAGMMMTPDGPRVLEFNARFGDPETQVILMLLESDFLEILMACAQERLADVVSKLRWREGAAAVVVLASQGYPGIFGKGSLITGVDALPEDVKVFQAGTAMQGDALVTAGGRVCGVTAYGASLADALERAYQGVARVNFAGMYYRSDIGKSAMNDSAGLGNFRDFPLPIAYEAAGVSISAGSQAVERMRSSIQRTYTSEVLSNVGSFGGLYHAAALKAMQDPVLVASTDGVGTKVILASQAGRFEGIGHDIVNHCINDILVQGAHPLFFLDYYASARLHPEHASQVVQGMSAACLEAGCALLGGETAEMPGVYAADRFDVVGTIIGLVERSALLPKTGIAPGDLLLGLASSGPHTNGYSLIRKVFADMTLYKQLPELGSTLADCLLAPHRSYLNVLHPLLAGKSTSASLLEIKALAHITGGGFYENIPRVLPDGLGARLEINRWPIPPIFSMIQRLGGIAEEEMLHVFNMGIGMVAVISPTELVRFQAAIPEPTWVIGQVVSGAGMRLG